MRAYYKYSSIYKDIGKLIITNNHHERITESAQVARQPPQRKVAPDAWTAKQDIFSIIDDKAADIETDGVSIESQHQSNIITGCISAHSQSNRLS